MSPAERRKAEAQAAWARSVNRFNARKNQARPGGLIHFVRHFWHVLEPESKLVEG